MRGMPVHHGAQGRQVMKLFANFLSWQEGMKTVTSLTTPVLKGRCSGQVYKSARVAAEMERVGKRNRMIRDKPRVPRGAPK